jgi:beta-glucanase (GH16 family)
VSNRYIQWFFGGRGTQHYALNGSNLRDGIAATQSGVDWTAGYHTYVVEWVPGQLRYYIDGVLRLTQNQQFDAPTAQMKLAIGTGTGDCGSWVGCPTSSFSFYARSPVL